MTERHAADLIDARDDLVRANMTVNGLRLLHADMIALLGADMIADGSREVPADVVQNWADRLDAMSTTLSDRQGDAAGRLREAILGLVGGTT